MPKTVIMPSGAMLLIGKDARDNEKVTLEMAGEDDMWFHADEYTGSHVVLKHTGIISPEEVQHAANVAASKSKGRHNKTVNVIYGYIRDVYKTKSCSLGEVEIKKYNIVKGFPQHVNTCVQSG